MSRAAIAAVSTAACLAVTASLPAAAAVVRAGDSDPGFGHGGVAVLPPGEPGNVDTARAVIPVAHHGVVAVGMTQESANPRKVELQRLTAAGAPDPSFGSDGISVGPDAFAVIGAVPGPSHTIVVGYEIKNAPSGTLGGFGLARFTASGALDTSYDASGPVPGVLEFPPFFTPDGTHIPFAVPTALAATPSGGVVESGLVSYGAENNSSPYQLGLAEADSDGAPVAAFTGSGKPTGEVALPDFLPEAPHALAVDPTSGDVYAGTVPLGIVRLTASGAPDPTYGDSGEVTLATFIPGNAESVRDLAVDPAGRLVAVVDTRPSSGGGAEGIARLKPGGAPDTSFATTGRTILPPFPNSGADHPTHIAVDGASRIIVAGTSTVLGATRLNVARVNPDGSLDTQFGTGGRRVMAAEQTGSQDVSDDVALAPGNRLLLDATSSVAGAGRIAVTRLLAAGAPVLAKVVAKHKTFRPASSGPSLTSRHVGLTIRYRESEAAVTTLAIQQGKPGARSHGKCVRRTHKLRHAPSCRRWVGAGQLTHHDSAGANTLHFTGRVHHRALSAGKYRLVLSAKAHGYRGKPHTIHFRIR